MIPTVQPPKIQAKYNIGGVEYKTVTTEEICNTAGVLYNKKFQSTLDNKGRLDLVKQIKAKQRMLFTNQKISNNDPEMLINHYLVSKTIAEFQRSMCKYGIKAVFIAVKPYDFDGTKAGQLEMDDNNNMIATNLFDQYC